MQTSQLTGTPNAELMAQARTALRGKWGLGVAASFLYLTLAIVLQSITTVGSLVWLIVAPPLTLGLVEFFLSISRGNRPRVQEVFEGFNRFGTAFAAYFLTLIMILLWMLLLIIPGIIAAFAYSQTLFILADDPNVGAWEAMKRSKEMMRGNKWKQLCLHFRFFWWFLLCLLTFGIGFLWVGPYVAVSLAKFYDDVKSPKSIALV